MTHSVPNPATRPRRRRKFVLFALLAGLLGLAAALAAAEILLRIHDPLPHPLADIRGLYAVDATGSICLTPGWRGNQRIEGQQVPIEIDSLGLRGPAAGPKRPGERRLLLVGDSFVFGQGVTAAEAIPAQLQSLLRQRGIDVEVGNAGIAGTGPREWASMLHRVREPFGVDAVIAVSFLGNDVLDTLQEPLTAVDGWLLSLGFAKHARESWRFRLRVASRLWDKVELALGKLPLLAMGQPAAVGPGISLADALFLDRDPSHDSELPFLAEVEAALDRAFTAFVAELRGLPAIVVLLPARSVVVDDYATLLAANHLDPALHHRGQSHQRMRSWLERRGLRVIDLLEPLLSHPDRKALYLPQDGHFNAAGCAAVAAMLADAATGLLR